MTQQENASGGRVNGSTDLAAASLSTNTGSRREHRPPTARPRCGVRLPEQFRLWTLLLRWQGFTMVTFTPGDGGSITWDSFRARWRKQVCPQMWRCDFRTCTHSHLPFLYSLQFIFVSYIILRVYLDFWWRWTDDAKLWSTSESINRLIVNY